MTWCGKATVALCITLAAWPLRAQHAQTDTGAVDFMVDHVHVILRRNTANDVVAANIYLLGGARQLTPQTAGIEALMLDASEDGTRRFPRATLRAITARAAATIVVATDVDWTTFGLRTLRQTFDSSWAVFADRLVEPALDSQSVERAREQLLIAARNADADPDAAAEHLASQLIYAGHPYRLETDGTTESLAAMTAEQVREYHRTQVVQSRLLLVVVGNVDRPTIACAVRRTLATLPVGQYHWTPPPAFTPDSSRVAVEQRTLPTNYILGYYPGPQAGTADYAALQVATAVLGGRMFAEVRSREHLAYAVSAPFVQHAQSLGGFYVTTTNPVAAIGAMAMQLRLLQTTRVDSGGLQSLVGQFITNYFLTNETNADQASFLARAQLYDGDFHAASDFIARLRRVTPADIQRVAIVYMHDTRFGFVGDTTKAPAQLRTDF